MLSAIKLWVNYSPYVLKKDFIEPIFIIGTGRSGTHFMDSILNSHDEITDLVDGKENPFVFSQVTKSALYDVELDKKTMFKYRLLAKAAYPKALVDQSHPNIWHVEQLLSFFPKAKFIGMVRCPFSVTYSAINHSGVSSWFSQWEDFPIPNKFLGVDKENLSFYPDYNIPQKSALRWSSHMYRLDYLARNYPNSVTTVNYESLCHHPKAELKKVKDFLCLSNDFKMPKVNNEALYKKNKLTCHQQTDIETQVNLFFEKHCLTSEDYIPLSTYL